MSSSTNNNQTISAHELSNLLLGTGSAASSGGALPTTANSQSLSVLQNKHKSKSTSVLRKQKGVGGVDVNEYDVSGMNAAEASLLLKSTHGVGKSHTSSSGKRHYRLQNNNPNGGTVIRDYHLGIQTTGTSTAASAKIKKNNHYDNKEEEDDDGEGLQVFQMKQRSKKEYDSKINKSTISNSINRTQIQNYEANDDEKSDSSDSSSSPSSSSLIRRRREKRQKRSSSSSSDSNESDDSVTRRRRRRQRGHTTTNLDNNSSSSSSESDEDETAQRRNRARLLMMKKRLLQKEMEQNLNNNGDDEQRGGDERDKGLRKENEKVDLHPRSSDDSENGNKGGKVESKRNHKRNDSTASSSSDNDSSDTSSSDSDSSSSSSSDDDPDPSTINMSCSKPIFVPKHKRNNVPSQNQDLQLLQQEKIKEQEKLRIERRIQSSRALVAEVIANEKKENESFNNNNDQIEFQESGGSSMKPPSDQDWTNDKEQMEQRDMWEVRELMRLLREYEEYIFIQQEAKERERRRNMTDEERYNEDVKSGKYRKPGEQRRQPSDVGRKGAGEDGVYLQRYYHRGAFYMDEDTLNQDLNDVRHRAAEYASAATGEDKVNRKAMPKVMQVKKFGFANQHKYKGLAMEDTTDKSMDFLPLNKSNKRPRQTGL